METSQIAEYIPLCFINNVFSIDPIKLNNDNYRGQIIKKVYHQVKKFLKDLSKGIYVVFPDDFGRCLPVIDVGYRAFMSEISKKAMKESMKKDLYSLNDEYKEFYDLINNDSDKLNKLYGFSFSEATRGENFYKLYTDDDTKDKKFIISFNRKNLRQEIIEDIEEYLISISPGLDDQSVRKILLYIRNKIRPKDYFSI